MMTKYKNTSKKSNVDSYEIGENDIKLTFQDNEKIYLYNSIKPGKVKVDKMKLLAIKGEGLNKYINKYVGKNCFIL